MNSVLIVSSSKNTKVFFDELLKNSYEEMIIAKNGSEARRVLIERTFDLCIINAPLSDEFGTDLAINIINTNLMQVMLIVKSEIADEVSAKVEDFGVFVISKPINRQIFWNALKLMTAAHNRIRGLKDENTKLQKKIEDIKFVDRAKCVLIEYLNMSEAQAHKFIEKQAMDRRITKKDLAIEILKFYGNY
ncbi:MULTISPECIES: ANTAR domain-containing response regulator [Clostridium]|uniref:ANTAR domain-containing response regulator n=1 Tax=Clostridium TaxID=1485 RepID=UPI000999DE4F|nr:MULTISPECIES: ANTAR domain-containing protein [Clostridium]